MSKWAIAQLADLGDRRGPLVTDWEFDTEADALDAAQTWLDGNPVEGDDGRLYFACYLATWQEGDDYVTTIIGGKS